MFVDSRLLFIYAETPLHVGTGAGLGAIDLPIQRERVTGYPLVQASGIKGALRSTTPNGANKQHVDAIFGPAPESEGSTDFAGALATGDARILLFPVRSLTGVFAWTTSLDVLRRWKREAGSVGIKKLPDLPSEAPARSRQGDEENYCYVSGSGVSSGGMVVLEEFAFRVDQGQQETTAKVADWLATNAFPTHADEYVWWGEQLRDKLIVLPDDDFRDFARYGTEILTRIRLDPDSKTVKQGALWTEEHLPVDTLLFTPVRATRFRCEDDKLPQDWRGLAAVEQGQKILSWVSENVPQRIQLGGDETIGRGVVSLRWLGG
jgi:CRISPR-associated protein Cmr4